MTKDELFAEVRSLENRAFELISDDDAQGEFDQVMARTRELKTIAKNQGWL